MLVRLLPEQVPKLWDAVKYASSRANAFGKDELPYYFNTLLLALWNGKAQCFVRVDDDRVLNAVMITRIIADVVTGRKALLIESLYSFKSVPNEEWESDAEVMRKFAKNEGCLSVTTYTNNRRVWEILEVIGLEERFRCFVQNFNGGE